jgi:hypothetical protein
MELLAFPGAAGKTILIPPNTLVTWLLCSQSGKPQTMIIRDSATGAAIVDSTVCSQDASNQGTGTFLVPTGGAFLVLFPVDRAVLHGQETMWTLSGIISQTHVFAGEDGTDTTNSTAKTGKNFQDAFALITWLRLVG